MWWGTRFKVIRLCCEEDEYASKIGISYSIYGVTGLVIGLINAGIIAAIANVAQGVQVMLIFLAVVIAVLGVASIFLIPDFKGEIDKNAKLFSLKEAVECHQAPRRHLGLPSPTSASTPCTRALPIPRPTSPGAPTPTAIS